MVHDRRWMVLSPTPYSLANASPGFFSAAPVNGVLGLPILTPVPHGPFFARLGAVDDEGAFALGERGEEVHHQASHRIISDGAQHHGWLWR